jgi:hypothetical protein
VESFIQSKDKPSDPVSDLHVVDAYMRWALKVVEEVVGKPDLKVVLRENDRECFSDNFPAEKLSVSGDITCQDYANLCTGVLKFYGRAGKSVANIELEWLPESAQAAT